MIDRHGQTQTDRYGQSDRQRQTKIANINPLRSPADEPGWLASALPCSTTDLPGP